MIKDSIRNGLNLPGMLVPTQAKVENASLGLCNPDVIFTPSERLELERDLAVLVTAQVHAANQASQIFVD